MKPAKERAKRESDCAARLTMVPPQVQSAWGDDRASAMRLLHRLASRDHIGLAATLQGRTWMFDLRDLFQWERFITPSIIKIFYWLAVGISALLGLSGILTGFTLMAIHPLGGVFWIIASLIGLVIGVVFARILAEFILIMFRINEHLGAIRQRGQM
jgi:Domain of unknown function (DUF4282)